MALSKVRLSMNNTCEVASKMHIVAYQIKLSNNIVVELLSFFYFFNKRDSHINEKKKYFSH